MHWNLIEKIEDRLKLEFKLKAALLGINNYEFDNILVFLSCYHCTNYAIYSINNNRSERLIFEFGALFVISVNSRYYLIR